MYKPPLIWSLRDVMLQIALMELTHSHPWKQNIVKPNIIEKTSAWWYVSFECTWYHILITVLKTLRNQLQLNWDQEK